MPTPAKIQETLIGWGFRKQTDIATANIVGDTWRFGKLNASLINPELATEDDAAEIGKGHEFPTALYNTNWNVAGQIEKYASSDFLAWATCFVLGHVVKSGTLPNFIYTVTPLATSTDGIELPYFTFVEQIRPGGSSIIDRMAVGCAIEDLTISIGSGPGRANSKCTVNFVGSGKLTEPSGISLPAATAEKLLPAASLAATIITVDYVSLKNILSLEIGIKNNLNINEGFFPGSGFQTGGDATSGAIRGRIEIGARQYSLKFTVRLDSASAEWTKLKAGTTGTAVIGVTYDTNNNWTATFQKIAIKVVNFTDANGIVTANCEADPLYDSTNGILSVVAKCNTDNICEAPV